MDPSVNSDPGAGLCFAVLGLLWLYGGWAAIVNKKDPTFMKMNIQGLEYRRFGYRSFAAGVCAIVGACFIFLYLPEIAGIFLLFALFIMMNAYWRIIR